MRLPRTSHSLAHLENLRKSAGKQRGWRKWVWAVYELLWGFWWSLFVFFWKICTHDFFRVHLTVFFVATICSGRVIAANSGIPFLDGWFLSVSAITNGGLAPVDMSRLKTGSHVILYLTFTIGGVPTMALFPLLWRVWLDKARLRPLIAEASRLTAQLAAYRQAEADHAQRIANAIVAAERMTKTDKTWQVRWRAQEMAAEQAAKEEEEKHAATSERHAAAARRGAEELAESIRAGDREAGSVQGGGGGGGGEAGGGEAAAAASSTTAGGAQQPHGILSQHAHHHQPHHHGHTLLAPAAKSSAGRRLSMEGTLALLRERAESGGDAGAGPGSPEGGGGDRRRRSSGGGSVVGAAASVAAAVGRGAAVRDHIRFNVSDGDDDAAAAGGGRGSPSHGPAKPLQPSGPSAPSLPALARPQTWSQENIQTGLRKTFSFLFPGGTSLLAAQDSGGDSSHPSSGAAGGRPSADADAAERSSAAAIAATQAEELRKAAAIAATFSEEDAADYAAVSASFRAQSEALVALAVFIFLYVVLWNVFGSIAFYREYLRAGPHLQVLKDRGIGPVWLSMFLTSSALNNTGLSLLDDSLVSIAVRVRCCMVLALAILAGNTAFPIVLRCLMRAWVELARRHPFFGEQSRAVRGIKFALDHPQQCYHLLYDTRYTLAIVFAVIVTNAFQLFFFFGTSFDKVRADLKPFSAQDGTPELGAAEISAVMFFQVISCRSAGFQVIDIKNVGDVMGVVFGFMFWLAPHPLVAALREAEDSEKLQQLSGADAEEQFFSEKGDDVEEIKRPIVINTVKIPARAGGGGAPRSARGSVTRRRRVGATAVTLPTVARLASVADTSHHGGVENARPASAPTDTAYADEITVEMKGTLATKAVEHAERAEEEDLRQKHTLRGVIMRRYVTRHATWLFLAFCTIAATEQHLLETPSPKPNTRSPTTLFAFLFEILSAYGTNGLSYGYPGVNYNLVGTWKALSKLVIMGVLFLGRHRNMPRAVDRPLVAHVHALEENVRALRIVEADMRSRLEAAHIITG